MRNLKRIFWITTALLGLVAVGATSASAFFCATTPSLDISVNTTVPVGSKFVVGGTLCGQADQITITVSSDAPGKGKNKTRTVTIIPDQTLPAQPLSEEFRALGPTGSTLTITAVATSTLYGTSVDAETTTIVVRPSGKK
ncbi:MAG: hypothetical protein ACYTGX_04075 [Planctomycetota bacterium]|jgi:hypothetical protein